MNSGEPPLNDTWSGYIIQCTVCYTCVYHGTLQYILAVLCTLFHCHNNIELVTSQRVREGYTVSKENAYEEHHQGYLHGQSFSGFE